MPITIHFDKANNPEEPIFVLAKRNGDKIGQINAKHIHCNDALKEASEFSFKVYKEVDGIVDPLWSQIKDFKLAWCKNYDVWYELKVDLSESNSIEKTVYGTRLGHAELSQIKLYDVNINTELDIMRDDYIAPSVFFNETDHSISILHRVFEKAPHYSIIHVDSTIATIQRTFTFSDVSIFDACQQMGEEIGCIFVFHSNSDSEGKIQRTVSVYDAQTYCYECGYRGDYIDTCPKCGSKNVSSGYGEDTTIFITADELGQELQFTTDTGAVKNCFRLVGGDDLMTAAIRSINPNGTDYLWHISDDVKEDMSAELVSKINSYDELYAYYQNDYQANINATLLNKYNELITKYKKYRDSLTIIKSPVVGFTNLMSAYYNTIDFHMYLKSGLMPEVQMSESTAQTEVSKLNITNLSPVAVQDVSNISLATANSVVLAYAKLFVDSRFKVTINSSSLNSQVWTGSFTVTNSANDEDTASTGSLSITITDDYEQFTKQKIKRALSKIDVENVSIEGLFSIESDDDFKDELKKYCLDSLLEFQDICQTCIDILIQQGIADNETWSGSTPNLYLDLYVPYYTRLLYIQQEITVRENELAIVAKDTENDSEDLEFGLQDIVLAIRDEIQAALNFENYLGKDLWYEFCAYRREDKFENSNYISDGLSSAELINMALDFFMVASNEIYKSAELQHSISSRLNNLLVIKKFNAIKDYFSVGNWIRLQVDTKVYRLRLLKYEIDFDDLDNLQVEFSDVMKTAYGETDQSDLIAKIASMASSYSTVQRQADKGNKSNSMLENWVQKGLDLTKLRIIDGADNQNQSWDSHGLLCREYLPITDTYDSKQLKIINRGLYVTKDNWLTSSAGIGDFFYWNPQTGQTEEDYGIIANKLVGNLILSERVGIYNTKNSITLDENGFVITSDTSLSNEQQTVFKIQRKDVDANEQETITPLMYIDNYGNLVLSGSIRINSSTETNTVELNDLSDMSRYTEQISRQVYEEIHGENGVYTSIDARYDELRQYTQDMLNDYKTDLGQYLSYDENGLTLGAASSSFRTVIDNRRLAFYDGDIVAAYISNNQLFIPNAVIQNNLMLGRFYFSPRTDGGVSLTWQG